MNCKECGTRLAIGDVHTGARVKAAVGVCTKCCTRHILLTVAVSSTKKTLAKGLGVSSMMKYYDRLMEEEPDYLPIGRKIRVFDNKGGQGS